MSFLGVCQLALLALCVQGVVIVAQTPRPEQCSGKANTLPVWTGEPRLINKTTNGSLYVVGDGEDQFHVLHVYGTAYQMGYAHGQLLGPQANAVVTGYLAYAEAQIGEYIKFLPKKMAEWIERVGLEAALDATAVMTRPYTPEYFFEEMHGLADATGIEYKTVLQMHMLPELIKASCSMMGAWGGALTDATGLLQLRALDFGTDSILQDYPVVTVYHPSVNGHAFASVGWAGFLTGIAGMSSAGMGISEKVSDIPFGTESRSGIPFNLLMRDVLQFDTNIDQATKRIMTAHRTCSIWLGVGAGAGAERDFRIFQYSASTAKVYTDKNITLVNETRFNREHCDDVCYNQYTMTDVLYWGVHLGCWNEVLRENHGRITPELIINMGGRVKTGDLLSVVYDLHGLNMYVSNAKGSKETGDLNAYDRRFVKLDAAKLFAQARR
ncbi:protein dcd1A-like [Sycon ciliatum]|uniref:protein dcd1A-like n=1 Tax=Sycon ciliatum TaxID=27933 RepID=UPI0031F6EACF